MHLRDLPPNLDPATAVFYTVLLMRVEQLEGLQAQAAVPRGVAEAALPEPARTTAAVFAPTRATVRVALISAVTTIVTAFMGGAVAWHNGGKFARVLYWVLDPPRW